MPQKNTRLTRYKRPQIQLPHAYLRLWDIGGQQALRSLWSKYYASCHAIVFVVDSTDVGDANLAHLRALADGGAGSTRASTHHIHMYQSRIPS